jgi:hypothetical protein
VVIDHDDDVCIDKNVYRGYGCGDTALKGGENMIKQTKREEWIRKQVTSLHARKKIKGRVVVRATSYDPVAAQEKEKG